MNHIPSLGIIKNFKMNQSKNKQKETNKQTTNYKTKRQTNKQPNNHTRKGSYNPVVMLQDTF
jgi:hypothetical protein